ncbi:hypothetical protein BDA99DRAFT_219393 [Phascolomyces articulosus]|uniref:Uncharacterized protein n=1 Tax=Phascolomyces articulosus TaxID=60185 RepID=A0AAD5JQU4_9FUNG|nr:hypothetical protein BDA99DRAFT_219393 [Phascolomyces articulosus]
MTTEEEPPGVDRITTTVTEQQTIHHPHPPQSYHSNPHHSQPHHHPHNDEVSQLYNELDGLLRIFTSDAQQKFNTDQHVANSPQLQRIRQTMQQVQRFVPVVGLVGTPNAYSLRQTLTRTALEMLEYYETACRQRRIKTLPEEETVEQLMVDWHTLSQTYDDKSKEHGTLTRLLGDVAQLKKAWRKPDQVESIVTSLLASSEVRPGMYVATIDRQNYAQLGLKRKALGSRQIVFECGRLSKSEQIDAIVDLCHRFSTIFMQNAQHNLSQIENQISLARPSALARKLKRLYDSVFYLPTSSENSTHSNTTTTTSTSSDNIHQQQQQQQQQHPLHPRTTTTTATTTTTKQQRRRVLSQGAATPFRLTSAMTTPSFIWYPTRETAADFPILTMPAPNFVPAPWQWLDLLKPRKPYQPVLFGLIKKRRSSLVATATTAMATHHHPSTTAVVTTNNNRNNNEDPAEDASQRAEPPSSLWAPTEFLVKEETPFATIAIDQLCQHLSRVGYQFYEDVTNNARLGYHQDSRVLQGIGQDLVEIYMSLQLESARSNMQRILTVVQQLTLLDDRPLTPTTNNSTALRPSISSV